MAGRSDCPVVISRLTILTCFGSHNAIDYSLKGGTITGAPPLISSPALYWTRYGGQVNLDTPIVLVCFDMMTINGSYIEARIRLVINRESTKIDCSPLDITKCIQAGLGTLEGIAY